MTSTEHAADAATDTELDAAPEPEISGGGGAAKPPRTRHRVRRGLLITAGAVLAVILAIAVVTSVTPWPSAMAIRAVFEKGGKATAAEASQYVPDTPLRTMSDIQYSDGGPDTTLDMFTPASAGKSLPTIVWIHGGAWISGSADDVAPYLRILAAKGYTSIALNYSLGPEKVYPTAVHQLNDALAYITAHAGELSVDPSRIILAGDSAGAQLASQLATLVTNADYADLLGIRPALTRAQLIGVILNCGVYDLRAMAELDGIVAWGFKIALWAYTGTKGWSAEYPGATMSTIEFVTDDFPPTFISGGNGDGLTWLQGIPMAQRLGSLGVDVTSVFWPAQHEPALPHEYQFHLHYPEAQEALARTEEFLAHLTAR
jgi:acetyl esterase/lipase